MSDTSRPRLKVSREGVVLIKSFEGFRPRAVRNDAGAWVIGYGHTASAREGASIGEADAELLLQYDLIPVVKALNEGVATPLNQHQFDALASFAISVGVDTFLRSDVLNRLNAGYPGEAADALVDWPETMDAGDRLRRRAAERALFVADPSGPVALADLLVAPLPPPRPQAHEAPDLSPVIHPDFSSVASAEHDAGRPVDPVEAAVQDTAASIAPAVHHQNLRYAAYAAPVYGLLPGFPVVRTEEPIAPAEPDTVESAAETTGDEDRNAPAMAADEPVPTDIGEIEPRDVAEEATIEGAFDAPVVQPVVAPSAPLSPFPPVSASPSPFPAMEELVLTPAVEADFPDDHRPVWSPEQRLNGAPAEPLFDDEPSLSVLRHEIEPEQPRRFDWSETGAFLIMGGVGLAACAASAAAFRLSATEPSDMGETTVIAWALALIGAICVGVSSWNLYVRWGKKD